MGFPAARNQVGGIISGGLERSHWVFVVTGDGSVGFLVARNRVGGIAGGQERVQQDFWRPEPG